MALSFTEGSIGGDIERVDLAKARRLLRQRRPHRNGRRPADLSDDAKTRIASGVFQDDPDREPTGSNGIAIAPSNTVNHHALLLINPHTSFFFRSELQMTSNEGLDAYGAVTWGQFFIYQGFNDRAGWMHTSSGVDAVDEYLETVSQRDGKWFYKYGTEERPLIQKQITVPYNTSSGMAQKTFTVYYTTHGPIIRAENGEMGRHQAHARADQGARTVLPPHQGTELHRILKDDGVAGQLLQQHHLRRRRRRHRLLARQLHPPPRSKIRLHQTRRRQRPRDRLAWTAHRRGDTPPAQPRQRLSLQLEQLALVGSRRKQSEAERLSRLRRNRRRIGPRPARDPRCSTARKTSPSTRSSPPPTTAICRGSTSRCPRSSAPTTRSRQTRLKRPASPNKSPSSANGTSAGPLTPSQPRSPSSGANNYELASRIRARPGGLLLQEYAGTQAPPTSCSTPSPPPPTSSPPTSAPGRPRGATSTASSASPATSSSPSTTRLPASPYPSPHRSGDLSPPSAPEPIRAQRSATGPAATASSPSSNSATRSAPAPSPPEAKAAIPTRPTSTTKPHATPSGNLRPVYFYPEDMKGHTRADLPSRDSSIAGAL